MLYEVITTFHLCQGKHPPVKRISGVVTLIGIVEHQSAVIHSHRQVGTLFLKNANQINQMSATLQMRSFDEVSIGRSVCATQMHKMSTRGVITSYSIHYTKLYDDTVRAVGTIIHKGRSSHIWNVDVFTSTDKLVSSVRVVNSILKKR